MSSGCFGAEGSFDPLTLYVCFLLGRLRGRAGPRPSAVADLTQPVPSESTLVHVRARVCGWVFFLCVHWLPCAEGSFGSLTLCGCVPLGLLRGRVGTRPSAAATSTEPVISESIRLCMCMRVCAGVLCVVSACCVLKGPVTPWYCAAVSCLGYRVDEQCRDRWRRSIQQSK